MRQCVVHACSISSVRSQVGRGQCLARSRLSDEPAAPRSSDGGAAHQPRRRDQHCCVSDLAAQREGFGKRCRATIAFSHPLALPQALLTQYYVHKRHFLTSHLMGQLHQVLVDSSNGLSSPDANARSCPRRALAPVVEGTLPTPVTV